MKNTLQISSAKIQEEIPPETYEQKWGIALKWIPQKEVGK